MKLTVILTAISINASLAAYSQKITFSVKDAPLREVLQEVRKQTGYTFMFASAFKHEARPVSVKLHDTDIHTALTEIFKNQQFTFEIEDKTILIKKTPEKKPLSSGETAAQRRAVSGTVTDEGGQPIVGVTVVIAGKTKVPARTDSEGRFSIPSVNGDETIMFSHVGYRSQAISLDNRSTLHVVMLPEMMDEVVVIGYGEVARKDLTGSVGTVKMADLEQAPVMSFEQALAGRVAGVQVTSGDGQPGSEGVNIVIRGIGSLTQSTAPLYVVDGFPMEDFDATSLNIDDIESINVLKDASATAIYGARGANGVIVVETKQGKLGLPEISYNGSFGFQNVTHRMEMMDPYDFVRYQLERTDNNVNTLRIYTPKDLPETSGLYDPNGKTLEDYRNIPGINWQDLVFQPGFTAINTVALRGGTGQTKYSISTSLYNQQGVVINSGSNRFTGRISLDQNISKKVKAGLIANYSNQPSYGQIAASNSAGSGHAFGYLMYTVWGFRPVSGKEELFGFDEEFVEEEFDEEAGTGSSFTINPVQNLLNEDRKNRRINFSTNAFIDVNVNKDLLLKVTGGYSSNNMEATAFYNTKTSRATPLNPTNTRGVQSSLAFQQRPTWKTSATLTYRKRFDKKHNVNLLGGVEYVDQGSQRYSLGNQLIPEDALGLSGSDNGVPLPNSVSFSDNRLASAFVRANYDFLSKYFFTATIRTDGSSKFAPENRWGVFPSGAFAWRINREGFLKDLRFISDAKLRVSYGLTGNNRVADFAYLSTITAESIAAGYSFNNGAPVIGFYPGVLGNKDLRWESTRQMDAGIDIALFKNRVSVVADVYRKYTTDLLLNANIPTHIGFSRSYKNIGELRNDGLEFTLNTVNLEKRSFSWSSSFNISFNRNKVISLTSDESRMLSLVSWDALHNGSYLYTAQVGQQAALFTGYIFDGIYQFEDFDEPAPGHYVLKSSVTGNGSPTREEIQPGDIKYKDLNGDGTVNAFDETIIGNPLPKHVGGFANNFSYKGLSLHVFLQWSYGNEVFNANRIYFEGGRPNSRNQFVTFNDRWTPENPSNTHFRAGGHGPLGRYSSKFIEDASFLRLKTISLSYQVPSRWLFQSPVFKNLSLTASAQNLATWTNYSGMDPEVSVRHSVLTPGFDWSAYPRNRIFVFGIKSVL